MKTIPFDFEKARAGAVVVNQRGEVKHLKFFLRHPYPIVDELNFCYTKDGNSLQSYSFHLLLTEEEKHRRAWKPEEVPVGALFKVNDWATPVVILGVTVVSHIGPAILICDVSFSSNQYFLSDMITVKGGSSYSLDFGKTWLPCGVEE